MKKEIKRSQKMMTKTKMMQSKQLLLSLVAAVTLLVPALSQAQIYSKIVDASSTNIPGDYSESSTSKVITNIPRVKGGKFINRTSADVAVTCRVSGPSVTPSAGNQHEMVVRTMECFPVNTAIDGTCYIRGYSGTVSDGTFEIYLGSE